VLTHLKYLNLLTLLFYQIEPYKKGPLLVVPSSIARNSSALNEKRIFQIHRGILEGCTNVQGKAIQALSEKLTKWQFLTPAWNSKFFWPNVFF
jgi:hypothetical protein